MKKIAISLFVTLAFALLFTACGSKTSNSSGAVTTPAAAAVVAEGHLVPNQNLYLAFLVRGRVSEIPVHKGDHVTQGQVLARMGDRQAAQASLAAAQLAQTSAQQAYDALVRTVDLGRGQTWQAYLNAQKTRSTAQLAWDRIDQHTAQTEIDNAQADVTSRQTDLENAQKDLDKYSNLPANNITRQSYEDSLRTAQTNYDLAVQKLDSATSKRDTVRAALDAALGAEAEAKHAYENTKTGPDSDKLALAQNQLDNARAQVAAAQFNLDNYDLKAPFTGTVEDINVVVGQMVGPETWAVALADTGKWYVDTSDLSELDVVKITVGQTAAITADALPGVTMTGVVESVSGAPKLQGGDVLYTVRLLLDKADPQLRWGMTMEVTFNEIK